MKLRFEVVVKRGLETVATIHGQRDIDASALTLEELGEKLTQMEAFLEKLTGLRFHIMQIG